jgi:hypothetical protein
VIPKSTKTRVRAGNGRNHSSQIGEPSSKAKTVRRTSERTTLERSLHLDWLARELVTAPTFDELYLAFRARVVETKAAVLRSTGMDEDAARAEAEKAAVSRSTLQNDITALQRAAENAAVRRTRNQWLRRGLALNQNRLTALDAVMSRALRAFDETGEAKLLEIAIAAIAAQGPVMAENLRLSGIREFPDMKTVQAPNGELAVALEIMRSSPEKAGQVVGHLIKIFEAERRRRGVTEPVLEGKRSNGPAPGTIVLPVAWSVKAPEGAN